MTHVLFEYRDIISIILRIINIIVNYMRTISGQWLLEVNSQWLIKGRVILLMDKTHKIADLKDNGIQNIFVLLSSMPSLFCAL